MKSVLSNGNLVAFFWGEPIVFNKRLKESSNLSWLQTLYDQKLAFRKRRWVLSSAVLLDGFLQNCLPCVGVVFFVRKNLF